MVEFAVLALLVTLLIAGGIELALAAFASQRASNGAESGTGAWIAAVASAGFYDNNTNSANFSLPEDEGLGDHASGFSRPA
jgi:Flp pilus assembly protein TadG